MWQTLVTIILLAGAAIYVARHFLKVYRTGNDSCCTGCSSCGCSGKSNGEERGEPFPPHPHGSGTPGGCAAGDCAHLSGK